MARGTRGAVYKCSGGARLVPNRRKTMQGQQADNASIFKDYVKKKARWKKFNLAKLRGQLNQVVTVEHWPGFEYRVIGFELLNDTTLRAVLEPHNAKAITDGQTADADWEHCTVVTSAVQDDDVQRQRWEQFDSLYSICYGIDGTDASRDMSLAKFFSILQNSNQVWPQCHNNCLTRGAFCKCILEHCDTIPFLHEFEKRQEEQRVKDIQQRLQNAIELAINCYQSIPCFVGYPNLWPINLKEDQAKLDFLAEQCWIFIKVATEAGLVEDTDKPDVLQRIKQVVTEMADNGLFLHKPCEHGNKRIKIEIGKDWLLEKDCFTLGILQYWFDNGYPTTGAKLNCNGYPFRLVLAQIYPCKHDPNCPVCCKYVCATSCKYHICKKRVLTLTDALLSQLLTPEEIASLENFKGTQHVDWFALCEKSFDNIINSLLEQGTAIGDHTDDTCNAFTQKCIERVQSEKTDNEGEKAPPFFFPCYGVGVPWFGAQTLHKKCTENSNRLIELGFCPVPTREEVKHPLLLYAEYEQQTVNKGSLKNLFCTLSQKTYNKQPSGN